MPKSLFERTKLKCLLAMKRLILNLFQIVTCSHFEKDARGGICYIFNTYSKLNNNYLKFYDPK